MAIVIDLKSTDSTVERRIDVVIQKLERLNQTLVQATANWRAMTAAAGSVPSAPRSARVGATRTSGRASKPTAPPFNHLAVLSDPTIRARVLAGDPGAAMLMNRATGVQRSVTRAQNSANPPGFGQNLQHMLMRSRFGGGGSGGVMPLGMDISKLMGGGKGGGIAALAIAAVMIKIKVMSAMFQKAGEAAKQFTEAMVGGGAQGAGAAVVLGGITGLGPGGASGSVRGRGMRETAFGASRGISPLAGDPFLNPGGANAAYQKMADAVAKAAEKGGFSAAQAEANRLGAPELAKLGLLSKGTREQVLASGKRGSNTMADRGFADLWAQISVFGKEFGNLVKTYMLPWLRAATSLFHWLNQFLGWLNDQLKVVFGWTGAFDDLDKKLGDQNSAMDEHTRAMREHSEILGGQRRAQNAVPRSVQGNPAAWIDREALRQSVRMGALI